MSAASVNPVPEVTQDKAAYDLSASLFASSRLFHVPLSKGQVLFNPDWRGLPIVVDDWVAELVNAFSGGVRVGSVLSTLPETVDLGVALDTIDYLEA